MKLSTLHLKAFGSFTDTILDFTCKGYGLHIVFGPNETGKSTALRALTGLLYGFGHRSQDAWFHKGTTLQVNGELLLSDGSHLSLTRYKRRKNDLINSITGDPFPQADLDNLLGKIGKEAYKHTFGISHESLRLGVESVLAAGGDLGQALFAATSGLHTLKKVMKRLEDEQSNLFSPRGTKPRINRNLLAIKDLHKQKSHVSISHRQWSLLNEREKDLLKKEAKLESELKNISHKVNLYTRHLEAIPHVSKWMEVTNFLEELNHIPHLREDFPQLRSQTQTSLEHTKKTITQLEKNLKDIEDKLGKLKPDTHLLGQEKVIEALAAEASIHVKAKVDLRSLKRRKHQINDLAQNKLFLLRKDITLDSVELFRLSKPEYSKLQRLGDQGLKLEEKLKVIDKGIRLSNSKKFTLKKNLKNTPETTSCKNLTQVVSRVNGYGPLENNLKKALGDEALLLTQAENDLQALGLWYGSLEEFEKIPLPTTETIRLFDTSFSAHLQSIHGLRQSLFSLEQKLSQKENDKNQATAGTHLPTLETLVQHREIRDRGWQIVRKVWQEKGSVDESFMSLFPAYFDLTTAFEQSVTTADQTSDLLRVEAESIAQIESIKKEIYELQQEILTTTSQLNEQEKAFNAKKIKWKETWSDQNIIPLTPREMLDWMTRVSELKTTIHSLRKAQSFSNQLQSIISELEKQLHESLIDLSIPINESTTFSNILDIAQDTIQHFETINNKKQNFTDHLRGLDQEFQNLEMEKAETEKELIHWRTNWLTGLQKLGFTENVSSEEVLDFALAIEEICHQMEKQKDLEVRINAIENDYSTYSGTVITIVDRYAHQLKDIEPEISILELLASVTLEKETLKRFHQLEIDKQNIISELTSITAKLAALTKQMELLCHEAGTVNIEELPTIERQCIHKSHLLLQLSQVKERLHELAAGYDFNLFIDKVKSYDPDILKNELEIAASQKQHAQNNLKEVVTSLAITSKELETFVTETESSYIAERIESVSEIIKNDVSHYLTLLFSKAILKQSMEQYRRKHQSPVLQAASLFFKTITQNSFTALLADYDERGEPVLKAKRQDDSLLTIEELSDGSRDQLFLSLRFGGLSRYIANNSPMPFVVDDVLVHFDDDRSLATLEAMIELSKKSQIIFFTHHNHLINLLDSSNISKKVYIHNL